MIGKNTRFIEAEFRKRGSVFCFYKSADFFVDVEKKEIYLHNSEKSCTFAAESCKELVIWILKS